MRIRRLTLTGFKSFVDPVELRIEPGLTGIVGPNGCGKSNLLEAIRWVMGEASARSLRGAGMEDVIFAGTAGRPARDFAEVVMTLDRPDPAGAVREAEVGRRIERGAGSTYRIDGREVRQKDVALLFADAAAGAHSPALVSQGRIGAIIAARPAERRAMLEEAAGIAGLHVRRRDAEQRLRATEANLARLDELLGDMDARVLALRRQARAAGRYSLLSADIRTAEARLIYARWRDAAAAAAVARREADAAEAMVAEAGAALDAAAGEHDRATARLAAARLDAQAADRAVQDTAHRLDTLRAERAAQARRLAEVAELAAALTRDAARERVLARDAADAIVRLGAEHDALRVRIADAETARGHAQAGIEAAEPAARDAEAALTEALVAHAARQAEARVAHAAAAAARDRLARAEAAVARAAAVRDTAAQSAAHRDALARAERDRSAAGAGIASATAAIADAERARNEAVAARDAAQAGAYQARAALASLESEAAALARSLPAASPERRALDLLIVSQGYEQALAAALGDDLDAPIAGDGALRWTLCAASDDPPLADGCEPLARHVTAPAELARRLAQIGVVDHDDGTLVLAPGQRLVTRDGRLRRWDGFVAEDRGAATAQALARRNRLADIQAQFPAARDAASAADDALAATARGIEEAARLDKASRWLLASSDAKLRGATAAADQAQGAIERLAAQAAEAETDAEAAAAERAAAQGEVDAAAAALAALPDPAGAEPAVDQARVAAEAARARLAQVRGDLLACDRDIASDTARRAAAEQERVRWQARAADAEARLAEIVARADAAEQERGVLAAAPDARDRTIEAAADALAAARAAVAAAAEAEAAAAAATRATEARLAAVGEAVAMAREARATAAARLGNQEQRRVEMGRIAGERFRCPAPLLPETAGFAADEVGEVGAESQRVDRLTADRERLGPVNLVAERDLAELEEARAAQSAQRDELRQAVAQLRGSIGALNHEGRARLTTAFEAVDRHFRRLFARLFAGGEAHLALVDADDPLEAGLEIMAQPPGKRLASLSLLSGGEQALTACALIFALFLTSPAPICVLDEVDAPLDDANVERFCDLLDQMVRETDTRYLVVTHNAVTMARMHRLFGVTMVERGVSRLVSVDLDAAETMIAAA